MTSTLASSSLILSENSSYEEVPAVLSISESAPTPSEVPDSTYTGDVAVMATETVILGGGGGAVGAAAIRSSNVEQDDDTGEEDYILNLLCELEGGVVLMLDKLKQNSTNSRDASSFLKKRALLEEEYARGVIKLAGSYLDQTVVDKTYDSYLPTPSKSYKDCWLKVMRINEAVGHARMKFATSLHEAADALATVSKEADKTSKRVKEGYTKAEKQLLDQEFALEKSKQKYEQCSEEWEKILLQRGQLDASAISTANSNNHQASAISTASPVTGPATFKNFFQKTKSPEQLIRLEEEARYKTSMANETYKMHLRQTNQSRQEYYGYSLPRKLRELLEASGEAEAALKYHLARYSYQWETTVHSEAVLVLPPPQLGGLGVRAIVEQINPKADLQSFLNEHVNPTSQLINQQSNQPISSLATLPKRATESVTEIPYMAYQLSEHALRLANPKPIFGIDLLVQLRRDNLSLPVILIKCVEYVEQKNGLESQGIYRMSGLQAKVKALKQSFDLDYLSVDLYQDEFAADVHAVAGVLKLYFRELPSPLIPPSLHSELIDTAQVEGDAGLVTIKELLRRMPIEAFETLKYLLSHLKKVHAKNEQNLMNAQNLGIVWSPTLMPSSDPYNDMQGGYLVIERLIVDFDKIF